MPGVQSQLWSCLLDALVLYPLVYGGRILDRFKLCCFLRSDGWIPDRGHILRCLLSTVLLVYGCECALNSKVVTGWMSGYAYNLTTSHDVFFGDSKRTKASDETGTFPFAVPVQHFYRSAGEDVSFDSIYIIDPHSADKNPNLRWFRVHTGVDVLHTSPLHNSEEKLDNYELISQLVILNITEEDYGIYRCQLTDQVISYFILLRFHPIFTRLFAPPGSVLSVAMRYSSVDTPHYDMPSPHYKINGKIDPVLLSDSSSGCSPALNALASTSYAEQTNFKIDANIIVNTLLSGSAYDEDPGELDRLLYTELYLRFCLTPERFGLYTFYITRTFYNASSKTSETVTAEHPWTILVEPRLPDGINWLIPGYDFIPVKRTELNNSYREMYQTLLSDEHMFEKQASVVLRVQQCVFLILMPGLCLVGVYIYSKYAPCVILLLWSYLIKFVCLTLPVRAHMPQIQPAKALPGYDLWILSSEDSKYWVNEHIIAHVKDRELLAFWEELLTPDNFDLSSSLDALVKSKKVVVVASPEAPGDRLLCFKYECLLHRVVKGLSPHDIMLVRWGNVVLDNFRCHNQFEFFDWDNTVFPRDAFNRKLSEWLSV